tara:strand:+ start:324 stop:515 length:192 start_codon:yes stop_codon:yes gene_type:complete
MPTYEYECTKCGYTFERIQSINDKPLETCYKCGEKSLKKLFHTSGIIFKGSGFYTTDYKKKGK